MSVFILTSATGTPSYSNYLVATIPRTLVDQATLFTAVGDVQIKSLFSECVSANDATASTLQYKIIPVTGASSTITAASASLASATVGTVCVVNGAALTDAPLITPSGVSVNTTARGIIFKEGTLKINVAVGSTTGTWRHYLKYEPLEDGAYVYAV